jgi:sugar diacid utilization regulator
VCSSDLIRFVIADNLFRRHLSNDDKIKLYQHLYENFTDRIAKRHTVTPATRIEQFDPSESPLTATIIARDTGQKPAAVQKQLHSYETQLRRESAANKRSQEEVAVTSASKSEEQMRAREREADRALKSAVEEISLQLQRTDVSDDWRRTAMQRVLRTVEKQQKLLPA